MVRSGKATREPLRAAFATDGYLPADGFLQYAIEDYPVWLIALDTGAERQLTNLTPDFDIRDFDVSPDGREVVLERVQERSDTVLLDLPRP